MDSNREDGATTASAEENFPEDTNSADSTSRSRCLEEKAAPSTYTKMSQPADTINSDEMFHDENKTMTLEKGLCDLNDDCLDNIFRCVSLQELNALNAACAQFRRIIRAHNIHRKHKSVTHCAIASLIDRFKHKGAEYIIEGIECYLQRFGHIIEHIDFFVPIDTNTLTGNDMNQVFTSIAKWCAAGVALKSLKTIKVGLTSQAISNGRAIFGNLTNLATDCHLNWQVIFPLCTNLEQLRISIKNDDKPFEFAYILPKLKAFTVRVYAARVLRFRFNMENCPNLNALSLTLLNLCGFSNLCKLKNLQNLYLNLDKDNNIDSNGHLQTLGVLSKLEKIDFIGNVQMDYAKFLLHSQSVETLRYLKLQHFAMSNAFITGLSRFRQLRVLKLHAYDYEDEDSTDGIWPQLQALNKLAYLHLKDNNSEITENFLNNLTEHHSLHTLSLEIEAFNNDGRKDFNQFAVVFQQDIAMVQKTGI